MDAILERVKGIAGLISFILTSVFIVLPDVPLWLAVASAAIGAIAVYVIPNKATPMQEQQVVAELIARHNGSVTE